VASAALAVLCGVTGCALERHAPVGQSVAEVDAAVKARLDRQWELSGLEGLVVRPRFQPRPVLGASQWAPEVGRCMAVSGIMNWGYDPDEGLFIPGHTPTTSEQLQFYWCFERYPTVDLLNRAQIDFIYDYYQRWLIPCLENSGYDVIGAPSRAAFHDTDPSTERWNPYGSLGRYPATSGARAALAAKCSPTVPGIEGWSEQ
jgi:hypothetical protein